jgi:trans-aconitate methyltransferase
MLQRARKRLPDHSWILSSIENYAPAQEFAAAVAWDSLFHIPRAAHAAIFANVRSCLPIGARFALTVGGSDHAPFTDTMFGRPFFYDSHPPETAITVLQSARFEILHTEFLNLPTNGRDKGRFAIVASAT